MVAQLATTPREKMENKLIDRSHAKLCDTAPSTETVHVRTFHSRDLWKKYICLWHYAFLRSLMERNSLWLVTLIICHPHFSTRFPIYFTNLWKQLNQTKENWPLTLPMLSSTIAVFFYLHCIAGHNFFRVNDLLIYFVLFLGTSQQYFVPPRTKLTP